MPESVQYELSLKDLNLIKTLQSADAMAQKFENTIGNIGKGLATYFAVDTIMNFGRKMIEAGTTVENARTGLTTLLRDANQAGEVIKNTMQDASRTPFAFEGLLAANKALISAGVDAKSAREDVLNLANAIAATGGGDAELQRMVVNMQQIKNTGKATALDIKQFAYAGVNIYQALAAATGKPIEKVKDMEVSYTLLTQALKKAHEEGGIYANGLENMAQNTSVKISNMGDTMFQFMVKMFDSLKPIIDPVIEGITGAINWVSSKYEEFAPQITAFAKEVQNSFMQLVDFIRPLFAPIQKAFKAMWDSTIKIVKSLEPLRPLFNSIFNAAREALGWIFNTLGDIFEVVGNVTSGLMEFLDSLYVFDILKGLFDGIWTSVKWIGDKLKWIYDHTIKPIVDGITWAVTQIKSITPQSQAETYIHEHYSKMMAEGKMTWDQVVNEFGPEWAYEMFPEKKAGKIAYEKNWTDFQQMLDKKTPPPSGTASPTDLSKPGGILPNGSDMPKHDKATGAAKAAKATTVYVTINDGLVKNMEIHTTTMSESPQKVKELITEVLLEAVNDSEQIANVN